MSASRLLCGDSLEVLPTLPAASIDACVSDPPYGLKFMGKAWDHGVPGEPYWREVSRVLKPGAYLLAFGGTRTYHRLTCAIEDAGFEIRDCLMWMYGQGFPKGKACLKPGWEPIVLARKPGRSTPLSIDACRLNPGEMVRGGGNGQAHNGGRFGAHETSGTRPLVEPHMNGRWPANVVLDEEAASLLDEQSGTLTTRAWNGFRNGDKTRHAFGEFVEGGQTERARPGDTGGASRFFYVAKASPSERGAFNDHPTVKPLALMRWLVRLVTPAGGTVLDPFCGSGSTLLACQAEGIESIGIDADPHAIEIARRRIAEAAGPLFAQEALSAPPPREELVS